MITRATLGLKSLEQHNNAKYISHILRFWKESKIPLVTSVNPYLIYHHTISVNFIATIQHLREPACPKECWGMLGFFEDIRRVI